MEQRLLNALAFGIPGLVFKGFPFVIDHIADGTLKTDGMIQHTFPLEDWETAFDYATGKYGDFKVAFTF